jgi:hypothetical protein
MKKQIKDPLKEMFIELNELKKTNEHMSKKLYLFERGIYKTMITNNNN